MAGTFPAIVLGERGRPTCNMMSDEPSRQLI
jgi:hypothetical protein